MRLPGRIVYWCKTVANTGNGVSVVLSRGGSEVGTKRYIFIGLGFRVPMCFLKFYFLSFFNFPDDKETRDGNNKLH